MPGEYQFSGGSGNINNGSIESIKAQLDNYQKLKGQGKTVWLGLEVSKDNTITLKSAEVGCWQIVQRWFGCGNWDFQDVTGFLKEAVKEDRKNPVDKQQLKDNIPQYLNGSATKWDKNHPERPIKIESLFSQTMTSPQAVVPVPVQTPARKTIPAAEVPVLPADKGALDLVKGNMAKHGKDFRIVASAKPPHPLQIQYAFKTEEERTAAIKSLGITTANWQTPSKEGRYYMLNLTHAQSCEKAETNKGGLEAIQKEIGSSLDDIKGRIDRNGPNKIVPSPKDPYPPQIQYSFDSDAARQKFMDDKGYKGDWRKKDEGGKFLLALTFIDSCKIAEASGEQLQQIERMQGAPAKTQNKPLEEAKKNIQRFEVKKDGEFKIVQKGADYLIQYFCDVDSVSDFQNDFRDETNFFLTGQDACIKEQKKDSDIVAITLNKEATAKALGRNTYDDTCEQLLSQIFKEQSAGKVVHTDPKKPAEKIEGHRLLKTNGLKAHYNQMAADCAKAKNWVPYFKDFEACCVDGPSKNVPLNLLQPKYNIYDRDFQDFALQMTNRMDNKQRKDLENNGDLAMKILIRARNMAIGTRFDIGWDGKEISGKEQAGKKAELEAHWASLKAYKLGGPEKVGEKPGPYTTKISAIPKDTERAALDLLKRGLPSDQVAFLNLANAFNVGGGHQGGNGSQEEHACMACDVIATLATHGEFEKDKGRLIYQKDHHLKAGENHCSKTRFINSDEKNLECKCISQAFADFRATGGSGEYGNFEKLADGVGLDPSKPAYQDRIKLDMRAVLRTAKEEGIVYLVLGASGCGAFKHPPVAEAKAWAEVLQEPEFRGHFKEISFAVTDPDSGNYKAFAAQFNKP